MKLSLTISNTSIGDTESQLFSTHPWVLAEALDSNSSIYRLKGEAMAIVTQGSVVEICGQKLLVNGELAIETGATFDRKKIVEAVQSFTRIQPVCVEQAYHDRIDFPALGIRIHEMGGNISLVCLVPV